jgi:hypothetical protein
VVWWECNPVRTIPTLSHHSPPSFGILHWVPGYEGIKGNERANELAQKATEVNSLTPDPATNVLILAVYARAKVMDFKPKHKEFYSAATGKHLQKINKALLGKHTNKLYNSLNRKAAATLV